jgi:hypothetical protein
MSERKEVSMPSTSRYMSNRVLLVLSAAAVALGVIGLILTFTSLSCQSVAVSGRQNCSAGAGGVIALPLYLLAMLLSLVASVLALVRTGVAKQWVWFGVIFLFTVGLVGAIPVLAYSLLSHERQPTAERELRRPDNQDLSDRDVDDYDYRSPRPA